MGEHIDLSNDRWLVVDRSGRTHRVSQVGGDLERMRALFASVLGTYVAEHHILAAHGEGIFTGLSGPVERWVPRVAALLEHLDGLRVIIDEWPAGHQMMSRTELRERAWNDATVAALIRPAAHLPNPHYDNGGSMVLFDTRRVLALERTEEWFQFSARLRHRRAFAAHDPYATRKVRTAAMVFAAVHPLGKGRETAQAALDDPSAAVRHLAKDGLERLWYRRKWQPADLDDPDTGPVAALLGEGGVIAAAVGHRDPLAARIGGWRMLRALAG